MFQRRKAFTLVELLIVVMIIALFIVFGAPAFNRYNHKQEVDTKAKEIKGIMNGAYVQSQYIEQGYDSVLVSMSEESVISSLAETEQCDITSLPSLSNQVEGVGFDNFKISYNMGSLGANPNHDSILICLSSSGTVKSFSYESGNNNLSRVANGADIKVKSSSTRYESSRPADQITFPYLYIINATNSGSDADEGLVTEIKYEADS